MKPQLRRLSRRPWGFVVVVVVALPVTSLYAQNPTANAKGKISRNMYRIPYADNSAVTMTRDYIDHGNTPAGDVGSMDMNGPAGSAIVAAAAGTVIFVSDGLNGCGCNAAYGTCANSIQIRHANGEVSTYLHIAQNSATNLGLINGSVVTQGQQIAIEGDVGWTCGSGRAATTSTGCSPPVNSVPVGATACAAHLHWNVVRETTGERVNPMTCNIGSNLYDDDGDYTAGPCNGGACVTNWDQPNLVLTAFGEWHVIQANNQITMHDLTMNNFGSLVLHAGHSVRMLPGFHVAPGGYARAEIGSCNGTAVAPAAATAVTAGAEEPPAAIDLFYELEGY